MVTRAVLRYVRISPRKFRQIIPIIKGKNPEDAVIILRTVKKGASKIASDLINSAIANAKRIQGVDLDSLYISKMVASGGPQLKRFRAASMGRASPIRKRTSHITLELDEAKRPEAASAAQAASQTEKVKVKKSQASKPVEKSEVTDMDKSSKHKPKTTKSESAKKGKE
ncbi:MAG: 50S ribosomal protein L22 [Candidatus Omnitrophica bacterium]|nr:50S ribosomal protein L22 [Candidatus Omnitrophota bacterium]